MRMISLLAGMLALSPALGSAQTMQDLIENKNSDHVLVHSGGYDRKTYSPLSQINRQNIRRLVPVWSSSLMNDAGELSEPAVYNGVMYCSPSPSTSRPAGRSGARRSTPRPG